MSATERAPISPIAAEKLSNRGKKIEAKKVDFPSPSAKKNGVSDLHRTATTSGRCYLPVLTELRGSWSCRTYPIFT